MTPDRFLTTSLVVGNAALVLVAAQLFRAAPQQHRLSVSEINAALINGSYYPAAFRTPTRPSGVVLLEALTNDGRAYLPDSSATNGLIREAGTRSADELMAAFREENLTQSPVEIVRRNFASQLVLDSASATRYLAHPGREDVPPDVASLTHGKQRLGVLGLSKPGVDVAGSLAIVFARLRLPVTETEPFVERASLVLLRRNDNNWAIAEYWPLSLKRPAPIR